ncbi:MAG: enoyl-CoA hydratase-related protein [Saprospiraceae bacterium]|nr:enoyl-CoA hydratase-related protein [Saprospiraceae bacterium]
MSVIQFDVQNNIGTIRFNRPDKYNAFNKEMAMAVQEALDECATRKEVRCILITGEGKAFSSGQDLKEVTDPDGPELADIVKHHYNPIIERLRRIEKPVVAAVNGVAAGAGANIALACDIILAKSSASFIQAFSMIGLIPDSGGTYFLPRLVGFQRALALAMLGEKVSASQAESMGMIYKSVEDEAFNGEIEKITQKLSRMPTRGLGLTKRAFNFGLVNDIKGQLEVEQMLQTEAGMSYDYQEGVAAFLEKRKPQFKGE